MGSCNKAMWNAYGIFCTPGSKNVCKNYSQHPIDCKRKLYFMPDVPHLFKNIKQALFNNKIITIDQHIVKENNLPSSIVQCKHIEDLAKHQDDLELKLVRKLHVDDFQNTNHFDKMKVYNSSSIINNDVSASLEYLVESEGYNSSYRTTAWFIKQVLIKIYYKLKTCFTLIL